MRVPGRPPKDTSSATEAAQTASDSMSDLGDAPLIKGAFLTGPRP